MIQGSGLRVLACFLDQETQTFVQLCKAAGYTTDLGGYYIRQLVRGGYLAKGNRGEYTILPKGKQELALHYRGHKLESRPRLVILVVATQGERFVVMKRARQPFIDRVEWIAGSVNGEERLSAASTRIVASRLGINETKPRLFGFFRRIDTFRDSLFDDKLFAVHVLDLSDQQILPGSEMGEPLVCTEKELHELTSPSRALFDILHYVQAGKGTYEEHIYELEESDLA